MNSIILTTNDSNNTTAQILVSDKILQKLYSLKYMGGFKRFEIDIYSDKEPKTKSQLTILMDFFANVFEPSLLPNLSDYLNK